MQTMPIGASPSVAQKGAVFSGDVWHSDIGRSPQLTNRERDRKRRFECRTK
jgi:hypothetical protein